MKPFTLTLEQVIAIYKAGIRRGESEACAYEWGVSPNGYHFDNLIEELCDIYPTLEYKTIESEIKDEISQQAIRNNK